MRGLALCSGVGGLELGVRMALDGRCAFVGHVERDAYAAATLVERMVEKALDPAPIWSDLESFDGRRWRGCVDLITAGFPCQPASSAGSRRGIDDDRWLWPHVRRIIAEVEPTQVFVENVPGLLSVSAGSAFRSVLDDLAALGFDAEWDCFSAAGVGAPHIRRRLYLLAQRVSDADRDSLRLLAERGCGVPSTADERHAVHRYVGNEVEHPGGARLQRRMGGPAQLAAHGRRPVGDTDRGRRESFGIEEHSEQRSTRGDLAHGSDPHGSLGWPPGPNDAAGWERWRAAGGPEPAVCRGADGISNRVDRLRCLGNAVVPAVAAHAFRTLSARLAAAPPTLSDELA